MYLHSHDPPDRELSSAAQNALREFYAERERQQTQFDELKAQSKGDDDDVAGPAPITMEAFTEDWGVSQFWVSSNGRTLMGPTVFRMQAPLIVEP